MRRKLARRGGGAVGARAVAADARAAAGGGLAGARCGARVGEDIALPVVDLETATRAAKTRIHALRAQPEVRAAKAAIVERHGSRKPPQGRRKTAAGSASGQLDLGF